MPNWKVRRPALTFATLIGAAATAVMLWHNVTKRLGVNSAPAKIVQSYPNYAPGLIRANEVALSAYAPKHKQRQIANGTLEFTDADAEIIKARAKRAFAHAPLNVKAITQIATADFLRTLTWADRDMLILAKSRNARDRQTLNALSFIDIRGGNYTALLEGYDLRHRLASLEISDLQVIRGLSTLGDQRPLFEKELASNPSWGADYFRFVLPLWNTQDVNDNRNSLLIYLNAQDDVSIQQELFQLYFSQLETLGLYDLALQDWAALAEVTVSAAEKSAIFNPEFKYTSAPPPFNWRTYDPQLAHAEIENPSKLFASSGAPKRSLLAQQVTNIAVGTPLRFISQGSWSYREQDGYFFWRLSCVPMGAPSYDIVMGDADKNSGKASFDLPPLPEGCDYQHLRLYSEPGGFSQRISLRLSKTDITPRALSEIERLSQDRVQIERQP